MYKKQKVIDFHTHVYPDELAPKALAAVLENVDYTPFSDETLAGLLKNMDAGGVDISVVQPVVTKQSHFMRTNEWACSICSERIIPFGGIYPYTDDYKRDIDFVVSLGLKGLKFHPEYQDFIADSTEMLPIYDYAASRGLIMLFHGGEDPSRPLPYKSSPKQYARIADELRGAKMVIAHLGGYKQWDDVETLLAGKDVWLDTSMGFEHYPAEQFLRIVKSHGEDRILFASDSPWSSAGRELEFLRSLPLSIDAIEKISGLNAAKLLGI